MDSIIYLSPAAVNKLLEYNPFTDIDLNSINLCLLELEVKMTAFQAYRTKQLKVNRTLIKELDSNVQTDRKLNHVPFNEHSKFHTLSNLSEGKPTTILEAEEKRNLFDVLKDSCNPQDSEASDVGSDIEKCDSSTNGPPSKKIKLEEEANEGKQKKEEEEEEEEEKEDINKGIRLLDQYMDCQPTEFSLVSLLIFLII